MIELTSAMRKFILHWGEMGTRWGINRTVAQIHALLYLSQRPLNAEEISETLSIARSTVSTGLHELLSWEIVKVVHVLGDRRDHFESMSDVWEMFRVVLDERKRREVDPTLAMLRESVAELAEDNEGDAYARKKLQEMLSFFETVAQLYDQIQQIPTETVINVAKLGSNVRKVLGLVTEQ